MKIQETKIVETDNDTFVELVISDNEDIDQAREYLVLHVRLPPEVNVSRFAAIQKAALQTARDVLSVQIQEKQDILGRVVN